MKRLCSLVIALVLLSAMILQAQDKTTKEAQSFKMENSKMNKDNPVVVMKTSMGTVKIELYPDKAPVTVKNFLSYVDDKYFDKTVFHRVMKNFMIQGGGFTDADPIKQKKTKDPIKNESDNMLSNERGTIAMARTSDPNSATSQFFINVQDNRGLDKGQGDPNGYCVFGKVVEGMDVVDKIRAVKTGNAKAVAMNGSSEMVTTFADVPVEKVVIESIRRQEMKSDTMEKK